MKINDYIFRFSGNRPSRDGLCRVRLFLLSDGRVFGVLTDIEDLGTPWASVTNFVQVIRHELLARGYVPAETQFVEHNEAAGFQSDTFDLVSFDSNDRPTWKNIDRRSVAELVECDEAELKTATSNDARLMNELGRMKNEIDPYGEFPGLPSPEVTKRHLEILSNQIPKTQVSELIESGSNEQSFQRVLKQDLSLIAEAYAMPEDEYICFSEFPVGQGCVDFAVFTGRSRMDVLLIEVKGADYYILNRDAYRNFASKLNEAVKQIQGRLATIYSDGLEKFRRHVHELRVRAESPCTMLFSVRSPD